MEKFKGKNIKVLDFSSFKKKHRSEEIIQLELFPNLYFSEHVEIYSQMIKDLNRTDRSEIEARYQIDLSTKMILETPKPPEDGTISMDYYCFLRFHKTNIKNYEGLLKAVYEFRETAKEVIEECCRGSH